ncbi:hypothetical protein Tsubulata_006262 [Turnera subulata]|uniref:Uncharacterized protein n=1 Tax=Turnera subulata TaxID=218843 RepID=A0A9Q0F6N7_9ROSI|nr:hypothetical protein Tsubulata_006262 [Turnera subulata]
MAFRANNRWRSVLTRSQWQCSRDFASAAHGRAPPPGWKKYFTGDMAPTAVIGGLLVVVLYIGVHSLKQQMLHHPSVHLTKKRRGSLAEVEQPDDLVENTGKFFNNSILRKLGNIKEKDPSHHADITTAELFKT